MSVVATRGYDEEDDRGGALWLFDDDDDDVGRVAGSDVRFPRGSV